MHTNNLETAEAVLNFFEIKKKRKNFFSEKKSGKYLKLLL